MHLIFWAEIDFACHYAMRRPALARDCARKALSAAVKAKRPDWAYQANALLAAI